MAICIAAAQSPSVAGDLRANVRIHLRFIDAARAHGAELLVFPELSLSGYELPLLRDLALAPDDDRLAPIREAAIAAGMTVVVGAPLAGGGEAPPYIAAFAYRPDGTSAVYRKQYLHAGEERYVQAGPIEAHGDAINGRRYALAICADTTHRAHAAAAAEAGASLYLAGVLISRGGYERDAALLQQYAADFGMGVLMANHAAPSGGYDVAGGSAVWAAGGPLLARADGPGEYLVIARDDDGWLGTVVPL
ncbi:putative amidohydrolase [Duganella sp. 1411]|uniref:carbon-nitrogen hydrolase family protein n=1 Tax=Duganella sp. 1411 TaxID=2806572 RepID=UPI001AE2AF7A|nr:carbon-nitrogen hydrolase family protein [Duganella sp. 1411]MBP1206493.1 putative amidohydrolase [Duganella sp. 1411]